MHLKLTWGVVFIVSGVVLSIYCADQFIDINSTEYLVQEYSVFDIPNGNKHKQVFDNIVFKEKIKYSILGIIGVLLAIFGSGWVLDFSEEQKCQLQHGGNNRMNSNRDFEL